MACESLLQRRQRSRIALSVNEATRVHLPPASFANVLNIRRHLLAALIIDIKADFFARHIKLSAVNQF